MASNATSSELRQDRTTGRWLIIAPHRRLRPGAEPPIAQSSATGRRLPPPFDHDCPFCPGNETALPGIIAETRIKAPPNWAVRVIPNKFPALNHEATVDARCSEGHRALGGYGFHEVIIESPRHDADLASMTDGDIEAVVRAYRDRSKDLLARPRIEAVVLFRNHGPQGGASLSHPHAQVVALAFVPPTLALAAEWSHRYHHEHGRCPTCDEIAIERDLAIRIVDDTQHFVALVPFASERPFETWLLPKQHQASFTEIDESQLAEFAHLLRRTLSRLHRAQDDPPYNFVIDSAAGVESRSHCVHWRLRIAPTLAMPGGFELGAGIAINPSSPEDDAAVLRAASEG